MQEKINSNEAIKILKGIIDAIERNLEYLTSLDQAIGDGDHGINLNKGFKKVYEKLDKLKGEDIGNILSCVGKILLSNVGGAVGPLYGIAFMRAGKVAQKKMEVDITSLSEMFKAAEKGIIEIGNASVGEKTMLDTIHPAMLAIKQSAIEKKTLLEGFTNAVAAAKKGMQKTKNMVSKRGRSSYLGERSIGHQDVGATSTYIILKTALDILEDISYS
jgi:dihydroxyacetone kinase-like protein